MEKLEYKGIYSALCEFLRGIDFGDLVVEQWNENKQQQILNSEKRNRRSEPESHDRHSHCSSLIFFRISEENL